MTARTTAWIATVLALAATGGYAVARSRQVHAVLPRDAARAHHRRALDHAGTFDHTAFHAAIMASLRADSTYLPAFLDYSVPRGIPDSSETADLYRVAGRIAEPRLRRCLISLIGLVTSGPFEMPVQTPGGLSDAAICEAHLEFSAGSRRAVTPTDLRQAADAAHRYPNSLQLLSQLFDLLQLNESFERIQEQAPRLLRTDLHPLARLLVRAHHAIALHRLGRDDAAVRAERDGWATVQRAGPGALLFFDDMSRMHNGATSPALPASDWQRHVQAVTEQAALARSTAYAAAPRSLQLRRATYQAEELLDRGELTRAEVEFTRLLPELTTLPDTRLLAYAYMGRGRTRVKLGHHGGAEADLLTASTLAGDLDLITATQSEHNLLHLYESLGQDREAEAAGSRFVARANQGAGRSVRIVSYRDLGLFYQRRGRTADATRAFRSMIAAIDRYGHDYQFAGEYYERIGELDRARAYYERVRDETDAHLAWAGLARIALAQRRIPEALEHARAYDHYMETVGRPEAVPLRPGILARTGDLVAAAALTDSARARAQSAGRLASWAILTTDRAQLALGRLDAPSALALADSASEAARRVGLSETAIRAGALAALAETRLPSRRAGRSVSAPLQRLRRELARARATGVLALEHELQGWLGDVLVVGGQLQAALDAYARAARLADSSAASMRSDLARAGYRATTAGISSRAIEAILSLTPANAAQRFASWSLRRKARELSGQSRGDTEPDPLGRIRSGLAPDAAIIDYVVLNSLVAALVITADAAVVRRLPLQRARLRGLLQRIRGQLDARVGSAVDLQRSRLETTAAFELYHQLLEPLEEDIGGRDRLLIVPDAELHSLAFDALALDGDGRSYAIDRYRIALLPSIARKTPARPDAVESAHRVLAVAADEVPDAAAEIDAIERAFPGGTVRVSGASASEVAVRRGIADATIVHFAVHAFPNDIDPEHAYLKLSPGPDDDGELHAFEVARWSLDGKLIVLSACETAVGPLFEAEGAFSLARAFFAAGAGDVVATLWPVSESASLLMARFYQGMAKGLSAAEALHGAKLQLRRDPPTGNPFHWAAFQLFPGVP